jgi:hypothetical protein
MEEAKILVSLKEFTSNVYEDGTFILNGFASLSFRHLGGAPIPSDDF